MEIGVTLLETNRVPTAEEARSHAIKNCASVVLALARCLSKHVDEEGRGRLLRLSAAARRLSAFSCDAFDPQNGPRVECDLDVLLERVAELASPIAEQSSVEPRLREREGSR